MKNILSILFLASNLFAIDSSSFNFLLKKEVKVKNLFYDKNFKKLVVLVNDDGTNRNGYAEYIALLLHDKGFRVQDVNVIYIKDAKIPKTLIQQGEGKVLGKTRMIN